MEAFAPVAPHAYTPDKVRSTMSRRHKETTDLLKKAKSTSLTCRLASNTTLVQAQDDTKQGRSNLECALRNVNGEIAQVEKEHTKWETCHLFSEKLTEASTYTTENWRTRPDRFSREDSVFSSLDKQTKEWQCTVDEAMQRMENLQAKLADLDQMKCALEEEISSKQGGLTVDRSARAVVRSEAPDDDHPNSAFGHEKWKQAIADLVNDSRKLNDQCAKVRNLCTALAVPCPCSIILSSSLPVLSICSLAELLFPTRSGPCSAMCSSLTLCRHGAMECRSAKLDVMPETRLPRYGRVLLWDRTEKMMGYSMMSMRALAQYTLYA